MNINIYGSTGEIGTKSLKIIHKFFPYIKINLLVANQNYNKLIVQAKKYKPKYIYLNDVNKFKYLKQQINQKITKLIYGDELFDYLKNSKSDISILSIAGYQSLHYFESIISNTKNLGIVNKESIVSAGHLFKKNNVFKKTNLFPLDSEHFSLFYYFENCKNINKIKNVFLTASGGPFLKINISKLKNINFKDAIKHPKWKMGYKNSIDSATIANKCLELVEAHYLFDLPYDRLDILIHPESLIHSIIEYDNYTSVFNYFYHDMMIPIYNFLNKFKTNSQKIKTFSYKKFDLNKSSKLNLLPIDELRFPIWNLFQNIDKSNPINVIKFNCANEFAVELFKNNIIKYNKIHESIENSLSVHINSSINDIKSIVDFQKEYIVKLNEKYHI